MLNVVNNILTLLFLMTFADSRLFTLDRLSTFYSRLSTFYSRLSTFTLDSRLLLSTLDFYSRLSTFTLDSRPSTFRYTPFNSPLSIFSYHASHIWMNAARVEYFGRNPNWCLESRLLALRNSYNSAVHNWRHENSTPRQDSDKHWQHLI